MKKKVLIAISSIVAIVLSVFIINLVVNSTDERENTNVYQGLTHINYEDSLSQGGKYYVYYYQPNCKYCENIEDDIVKFASDEIVYAVNLAECTTRPLYNWEEHKEKYAVEIGKIDKDGKVLLDQEFDEKRIQEFFRAYTSHYISYSQEKIGNKVYAVLTTPVLDYSNLSKGLVIPGVPILLKVDNGVIDEYYYDDREIISKLGIDKSPLDEQ